MAHKWRCGLHCSFTQAEPASSGSTAVDSMSIDVFAGSSGSAAAAGGASVAVADSGIVSHLSASSRDSRVGTPPASAADGATMVTHGVLRAKSVLQPRPTFLQVVESSGIFNISDDAGGAPQYTFCLWCNTCNCPATGCICKHVICGRIEYQRDGHSVAWSDLLLDPLTHASGRHRELYASGFSSASDSLVDRRDATHDPGSTSDDCSDSESEQASCPPHGIFAIKQMPPRASWQQMRAAQPVRKHHAEINVASALTALEQDAARVVALSISIGRALSAAADSALVRLASLVLPSCAH